MTYDQFWNDDPWLVKYYREAEKLRQERKNRDFWLQGLYVYDAFGTVMGNLYRKKGDSPKSYAEKPYNFNKSHEETVKEEKVKAQAWMINFVNFYKK